jgi:hypothetical protein
MRVQVDSQSLSTRISTITKDIQPLHIDLIRSPGLFSPGLRFLDIKVCYST